MLISNKDTDDDDGEEIVTYDREFMFLCRGQVLIHFKVKLQPAVMFLTLLITFMATVLCIPHFIVLMLRVQEVKPPVCLERPHNTLGMI